MKRFSDVWQMMVRVSLLGLFALTLNACDDGARGLQGEPGVATVTPSSASSLSMSIQSVTVDSPPVVVFSVSDQSGNPVAGLTASQLNFTLAKLMPGSNGDPGAWQSYILTTQTATATGAPGLGNTALQATRENDGTLTDNGDGTYSYTFATDITSVECPTPCTDADGNALDVSYQPTLTHRLAMQTGGGLPEVNVVYDFRPSDGATSSLVSRDIVATASCNECHNELEAHDGRKEVGYCVTCHNPGTTDPDSGHTVDFKVMIHKIHRGINLPSVVGPDGEFEDDPDTAGVDESADNGTYVIWGYRDRAHDYTTLGYPQDIRNCTKCHDGSDDATPEGDNWQTQLSMEACGSCHDDIDFSLDGSASGANDPNGHSGGIVSDNSVCTTCHAESRIAGSVAASHNIPEKVATGKFQFNILAICGTAVDSDPTCGPGADPTVTFSVSDPTGGTHGYGTNYDVLNDPEFTTSGASFNLLTAWNTQDYTNEDGTGSRPSRANSVSILSLTPTTEITDNGGGQFTVTAAAMDIIPATATGSGAMALEGHPMGESDPGSGTYDIRVPVKGEVAYFAITDSAPVERRVAVDLQTKCDQCHDQLSLHGNNRAENAQLCVLCHNPRGTDANRRPKDGNGMPDSTATLDGKGEESIDFKRLIHAIHAGAQTEYDGSDGHGFRENGLVVYGYGGSEHDYSHVRFPGILSDCTTCHNEGTYELTGTWETPTQNGILASTLLAVPEAFATANYSTQAADQTNDEVASPTAAVCSACHDSALAQAHMETIGGAQFNVLQSNVTGSYESCSVCHGPGRSADVKVVHGVE